MASEAVMADGGARDGSNDMDGDMECDIVESMMRMGVECVGGT